ncbi:MAG: DUF4130 domain-containing protein [Candidatus Heimdallarchaeota archaeon]|nr:DUF4130 domain-containing protein [Candidatus Heimdallarchaeota archaeon]MCK4954766.1 DUF4130 domain-containing protein [Candidatus Heimdallarchaeota archaeon]
MFSICNMSAKEYVQAAICHKDSSMDFIKKANLLLKTRPHEITTGFTEFGAKVKKRANAVLREIHLFSAYTRLKPFPEMLLVGKCKTEHNTGTLIAKSLARRFNSFILLIFTQDNYYIDTERNDISKFPSFDGNTDEEVIVQVRDHLGTNIEEILSDDILLHDGDFLWEKYYETQFLEQRLNIKQFRRFIPKYVLEKADMKIESEFYKAVVEQREEKRTLDDFFKQKETRFEKSIKKKHSKDI